MAYRVTGEEVKEIVTTQKSETAVQPFIRSANVVVNSYLGSSGLSSETLTEIELWLAAHFVLIDDKQENFVWIGEARARFGGQFGFGLDFTSYGQQVKILDSTGTLANIGRRAPAVFKTIGESYAND